MAYVEPRTRTNGPTVFYIRWADSKTGRKLSQKFRQDQEADARFLLTVLKAHESDTEAALTSARAHYGRIYTVSTMVDEHIGLLTGVTGYTVRRYRGDLRNHLTNGLGTLDASKVGYRDVVEWVQSMQAKGLKAKTIANVHGLLSDSFNTMVKEKKGLDNPCKGVALPKSDAAESVATFLTRGEWTRLLPFINEPHRALFEFLAPTGLRYSEATALYARDFQTDARGLTTVKISRAWKSDQDNKAYLGPPKTLESRRLVVVQRGLELRVRPLLQESQKTGKPVFLNSDGERMDHRAAYHAWVRALDRASAAGIIERRPRIHDLRHSNASWLLQAGLDMFKLQKHLGHKSITTTINRSSHLLPEAYDDAAAAMERVVAG